MFPQVRQNKITFTGLPPKELVTLLFQELNGASEHALNDQAVLGLKRSVQRGLNPSYEHDWPSFSYLYFGANFFKTFSAVRHVITPRNQTKALRVLDLGCGAGASSAGALIALSSWVNQAKVSVELTGVERDPNQRHLYKCVFQTWASRFRSVKSLLRSGDASLFLRNDNQQWDLIIASYLLAELTLAERSQLRSLLRIRHERDGTEGLIIDTNPSGRCAAEFVSGHTQALPPPVGNLDLSPLAKLRLSVPPMYASFL